MALQKRKELVYKIQKIYADELPAIAQNKMSLIQH